MRKIKTNKTKKDINKYSKDYSEQGFWDKITQYSKEIGGGLVYKALQLYYVMERPDCPRKVKAAIMGALAYLILPLDLIPDLIPVVGYTDDAGVIAEGILLALTYIDDGVKEKARKKFADIFGEEALTNLD